MRKKKLAIVAVCTALSVAAMTGCSKGGDAKKDSSSSSPKASIETVTTPPETESLSQPDNYGTATVKPESYKGIAVTITDPTVSDEVVQQQVDAALSAATEKIEITDRAAQKDDTVNIDYVGKIDGKEFDGGSAKGYDLKLGSGTFIPGFEDGLIGAKKGETKDVTVTFPKDYQAKDLAGKQAVFTVTVNGIYNEKKPELTDEWVTKQTNGAQTTVDAYKQNIKATLEKQNRDQAIWQQALPKIVEAADIKPEQAAIDYEYKSQLNNYKMQIYQYMQTNLENYAKQSGTTVEQLEKDMKTAAETSVKQQIVVNTIFNQEKLEITDDDYKQAFGSSKEDLIKTYGQQNIETPQVQTNLKYYKVARVVIDNANVTTKPAETSAAAGESAATTAAGETTATTAAGETTAATTAAGETQATTAAK